MSFLGEVFPQLLSNSHATTITKQKIFFFKLISVKDKTRSASVYFKFVK